MEESESPFSRLACMFFVLVFLIFWLVMGLAMNILVIIILCGVMIPIPIVIMFIIIRSDVEQRKNGHLKRGYEEKKKSPIFPKTKKINVGELLDENKKRED